MYHIVLDTETTGLNPQAGHKLVEIGCVELHHFIPTGRIFHCYLNPEREMPFEAFQVHGLSEAFLKEHPPFREKVAEFLDFIADTPLVIHNAKFDMNFINHELKLLGQETIPLARAIDTVYLAKKKFPGSPVSLDALCKKFAIDNTGRVKHGALLDAELLAEVYLCLMGGRQQGLAFDKKESISQSFSSTRKKRPYRPVRSLTLQEEEHHQTFLKKLIKPLWAQDH